MALPEENIHRLAKKATVLIFDRIYDWFQADYGGSGETVVRHLQQYAAPDMAARLKDFRGKILHDYDWGINEP